MQKQHHTAQSPTAQWVPLSFTLAFMMRRKRLMGWSLILFAVTFALTWIGYLFTVDFITNLTGSFFLDAPSSDTIWGWIKHKGWLVSSWLFIFVSRIVSFYLAFLLAYSISTPGYVFLSTAAEKLHAGEHFDPDAALTPLGVLRDIFEGIKIAAFGIAVTIVALFINFIPGIGQAGVFLLYTYYSALMFIDYPASRRRWSLGKKIGWLRNHSSPAFRIGVLPALVSMVPLLNIFAMALLFPILTIHATLNFSAIELAKKRYNSLP
ncbi:MAG: EI24 domain-containing protein [Deltaproteobacteria bacterium]|nr:EI24 domain-containing protein [Deltaproteobacteria bacterium]